VSAGVSGGSPLGGSPIDRGAVDAIVTHMNRDHAADNLVIVRGHGARDAVSAALLDLDREAGVWSVTTTDDEQYLLRVPWQEPLSDRRSARVQIVALFEAAGGRRAD
jgi:hypothetical protein